MKTQQHLTIIALKQKPKKKALYYQVFQMGKVAFEGDIRLCMNYIKQHNLKTKPKGYYGN